MKKKIKGKESRIIFSRDMTEDQIVDAIKKLCKEHGIKFVGDEKPKRTIEKRNKGRGDFNA